MRLRNALVLALAIAVAGTACSSMSRKFTFMRPEVSRKKVTRVAPEYTVKRDDRRSNALAAMDRVALAEQRLRSGNDAEAESNARAALKLDPRSADAYTILAILANRQGKAEQAGVQYAKAAELAPTRGAVLNNYGAWLCGNGRAPEALGWFDRALADPAYATPAQARANAGACAVDARQYPRAERDLRIALAQAPSDPVALAAMARAAYAQGDYMEARAFSERRIAAAPPNAEVLRVAAQIEQKLGDNQAAARYLEQIRSVPGKETVTR